jgi:4-hydroxy 2-oxovalerate aldolase
MAKLLDCTLRDGGYYTNWDFGGKIIEQYIKATNILPIDYLELGYRNLPSDDYMGKYAYLPVYEIEKIRRNSTKKLAIMLNEKSTTPDDLEYLISPIKGLVDMVRLAIDPSNFKRALNLAAFVKSEGFEVAFNLMYMSKWKQFTGLMDELGNLQGIADLLVLVDSFGGVTPSEVEETIEQVRLKTNVLLGFHGHNNLELGLINTITAIENNIDLVDATILGMGRGAGNLKMELLLTYLNKKNNLKVDFNVLGNAILAFETLLKKHKWGTSLPYMLSGANSLSQKNVMKWVNNRIYSFNSIIRAVENTKENRVDNDQFPIFDTPKYGNVLIVGGGKNAVDHFDGIKEFIRQKNNLAIIHATARNSSPYLNLNIQQFFCLVGSEGMRLSNVVTDYEDFKGICILPPYPRKMGTEVPQFAQNRTYELNLVNFTDNYQDSCTTIALQLAIEMKAKHIFLVGYDGYPNGLTAKEIDLANENEYIFDKFNQNIKEKLISLTYTVYKNLKTESIYQGL